MQSPTSREEVEEEDAEMMDDEEPDEEAEEENGEDENGMEVRQTLLCADTRNQYTITYHSATTRKLRTKRTRSTRTKSTSRTKNREPDRRRRAAPGLLDRNLFALARQSFPGYVNAACL